MKTLRERLYQYLLKNHQYFNGGLAGNLILRVEEFEEFRNLLNPFKIYDK